MNALKRRSRMVSFRLSEEEYEGLKHVCMTAGARSLSDIARDAVQRLLGNATQNKADSDAQLGVLYQKLGALEAEVKRLAAVVGRPESAEAIADAATASH